MAILIGKDTRVLVQGITGREGGFHAEKMLSYGTRIVGGVTPGKGGLRACDGRVSVFDTVAEAVACTGANASVIYVPARFALDAIIEASDAGIRLVVCITEGIPVLDVVRARAFLDTKGTRLIGPNSPGLISPELCNVGIIPGNIATTGSVGVVSRSGTLAYEVIYGLSRRGYGQSTCVGIGGDPVIGMGFVDILRLFQEDPGTSHIVLIGEIGGTGEQRAAEFIREYVDKPVIGFVAGRTAPPGRRMGHAGAIIERAAGSASDKIQMLRSCGVRVAHYPDQIADLLVAA